MVSGGGGGIVVPGGMSQHESAPDVASGLRLLYAYLIQK